MNRKDAANLIRDYMGDRLIRHDQWGSRFDYSRHWDSSDFARPPRFYVQHHHGATAQLPILRKDVAAGLTPADAEAKQMRRVDYLHAVGNGWPRGFAYCLGLGALTGNIYEARSAWVTHGAHLDDPLRADFPVYHMLGSQDVGMTDAEKSNYQYVKQMLREVFGFIPTEGNIKWHGEVQTSRATACAGPHINAFVRQDRTVVGSPPSNPVVWPFIMRYGTVHEAVRQLRFLLRREGLLGVCLPYWETRFTRAVETAVKAFQAIHGLHVDGIVGPATRKALGV